LSNPDFIIFQQEEGEINIFHTHFIISKKEKVKLKRTTHPHMLIQEEDIVKYMRIQEVAGEINMQHE
jgi:hypothetical protein